MNTKLFLPWLSGTYYRYIVLFEMQNHFAHYKSHHPQWEKIRNANLQPHDLDTLCVWVNCTSNFLLQCIEKPFAIIFLSVRFLSAVLAWNGKEFFKQRGDAFISGLHLRKTCTCLCEMDAPTQTHTAKNHLIGLLLLNKTAERTLRNSRQRNSIERTRWRLLSFPLFVLC